MDKKDTFKYLYPSIYLEVVSKVASNMLLGTDSVGAFIYDSNDAESINKAFLTAEEVVNNFINKTFTKEIK